MLRIRKQVAACREVACAHEDARERSVARTGHTRKPACSPTRQHSARVQDPQVREATYGKRDSFSRKDYCNSHSMMYLVFYLRGLPSLAKQQGKWLKTRRVCHGLGKSQAKEKGQVSTQKEGGFGPFDHKVSRPKGRSMVGTCCACEQLSSYAWGKGVGKGEPAHV